MRALTRTLKALADNNRLRILKMLQSRSMCVCELREVLGLAQPSVSKHLKILKDAGLIVDAQEGLWTNYLWKPENSYARVLLKNIRGWINEDPAIVCDARKSLRIRKETLCKK